MFVRAVSSVALGLLSTEKLKIVAVELLLNRRETGNKRRRREWESKSQDNKSDGKMIILLKYQ